jgi:chemotaxis protein methyltransferase CheR
MDSQTVDLGPKAGAAFEPSGFYRTLRNRVTPVLRTLPSPRIWLVHPSAEEVWSMAIVLAEADLGEQIRIHVTQPNDALLRRAKEASFPKVGIDARARRYADSGGRAAIAAYGDISEGLFRCRAPLGERLIFTVHRLGIDPPFDSVHAIVAKDVLRAFDPSHRYQALDAFHRSLNPFGFLALAPGESLRPSPYENAYVDLGREAGVFKKGCE